MSNPGQPGEPAPSRRRAGRGTGWLLIVGVLTFALLSAAALVLTDDVRWLRMGIVAALWAALLTAFATRHRRDSAADDELRQVYELELEREVAARREYELEVEVNTRRRLEAEVRDEVRGELDGLRNELRTLRQNLEALLGGEVLVERVALRAESTRLRSLSDQSRAARSAERALPHGSHPGGQWRPDAADTRSQPIRTEPVWPPPARPQPQPAPAASTHQPAQPQPAWSDSRKPVREEQRRAEPARAASSGESGWRERSQPQRPEPGWQERSQPQRLDAGWQERSQPQRLDAGWRERSQPQRVQPADPTAILPRYQGQHSPEPARQAPSGDRADTSQQLDFRPLRRPEPVPNAANGNGGPGPRTTHGDARGRADDAGYTGGRRRRAEEDSGRSVNELLASYSDDTQARRRHRREDR